MIYTTLFTESTMSLSQVPLECVNVFDPLIDIEEKKEFFIVKSGSQQTYYVYPTSSFSSSSATFGAANPPSAMTIVNRKVYAEFPIRIILSAVSNYAQANIVGVPPGIQNTVVREGKDALRSFPLSNCVDTLNVTINNQNCNINLADVTQAFMRYNTDQELSEGLYSQTPVHMDTLSSYTANSGASNNPLGGYSNAVEGGIQPRGAFGGYKIAVNEWVDALGVVHSSVTTRNGVALAGGNGGTIYAVIDCWLTEPILLSPFFFGKGQSQGFYSVSNMNFTFNFIGQTEMACRMWSHDDGMDGASPVGGTAATAPSIGFPVAGLAATFPSLLKTLPDGSVIPDPTPFANGVTPGIPRLTFQYLTPLDNMILPEEKAITYPYNVVIRYPFEQDSAVTAGSPTQIVSQSLQLTTIPRRIYIWVRESHKTSYKNTAATDTFFSISNISVQFQNKNGQLSSATQNQLYQIAKKNGCNMNFTQWSGNQVIIPSVNPALAWGAYSCGTIGSVVCLELATDLGLSQDMCPGMLTQSLLQVQVQCTNISKRSIIPVLVVATVQEGSWVIQNKASYSSVGIVTMEDIKMANERPHYNMRDVEDVNGGNFFSGLKNVFSKIGDFFKKHSLLSKGLALIPHPHAQLASKGAEAIGYGHQMHALPYAGMRAGVMAGWDNPDLVGQQSHGLLAGKRLTSKQLAKRLMY